MTYQTTVDVAAVTASLVATTAAQQLLSFYFFFLAVVTTMVVATAFSAVTMDATMATALASSSSSYFFSSSAVTAAEMTEAAVDVAADANSCILTRQRRPDWVSSVLIDMLLQSLIYCYYIGLLGCFFFTIGSTGIPANRIKS